MAGLTEQRERIVGTLYAAVLSDVMDGLGLTAQAMRPFVRPLDEALVLFGRARTGLYMPRYQVEPGEDPYMVEIALVDDFPIFSNCRVMPAEDGFWYGPGTTGDNEGRLQARMDVDLSDVITIGIETTLNLNWPKPMSAVLPVALAVTIVRFSGTLALSFIPSSSPPSTAAQTPSPTSPTHPHVHDRDPRTPATILAPRPLPPTPHPQILLPTARLPSPSPSSTTTASTSPSDPSWARAHACKTCPRSPS